MSSVENSLQLRTTRISELDEAIRATVVRLCIMILRLARTPSLDLHQLLTIEAHPERVW
jgi:hypothetical protein